MMNQVTRRDALRLGGLALVGLAAAPVVTGCAGPADTGDGDAPKEKGPGLASRDAYIGLDEKVKLRDGSEVVAINLDNAATTPALASTLEAIRGELPMYGSVGRGKGQKQAHSTEVFNDARKRILGFFNAPESDYMAVWCGTTTDALNKIAGALVTSADDVILTTRMEHHANDLPWRARGIVKYAEVDDNGRLVVGDVRKILSESKVKVVSVQAASNVTGYVNDVHAIAKMAHDAGAIMVVDGAQISAHRAFSMAGKTTDEDIDLFVCSGHKMYAPFGSGVIIGKQGVLDAYLPSYRGGGMVDIVSDSDVTWLASPDRWEAGSPNYLGVVALTTALDMFDEVTFDAIERHEQELLRQAVDGLLDLPKVTVYGDTKDLSDRVGVVSFGVDGMDAADVASALANDHGIAVRQGEFCAHPYCHRLMGVSDEEIVAGMKDDGYAPPAMVRISFGLYTTPDEVDKFLAAMAEIAK